MNMEADPNGINQHDPGAKLDEGKLLAGVLAQFSRALTEVAKVGTYGANKYSRGGWQHVEDGEIRYYDAMWRHILAEGISPYDDSGLLHAAQIAWNALARLELIMRNKVTEEFRWSDIGLEEVNPRTGKSTCYFSNNGK